MPASRRADPDSGVPAVVLAVVLLAVAVVLPLVLGAPVGAVVLLLAVLLGVGTLLVRVVPSRWLWLTMVVVLLAMGAVTARIDESLPLTGLLGLVVGGDGRPGAPLSEWARAG